VGSKLEKRLLRSRVVHATVCWIAATYIRFVNLTTRWTSVRLETLRELQGRREPFLLAFWHGRLLLLPSQWKSDVPLYGLVSSHRDGRLIAGVIEHLGVRNVAGSSTRGGAEALRGVLRVLREGGCIAVAPDGPRGPRMRVGGRVLDVARLTGVPILPVAYSAKRRRVLSTWDRFLLPIPFNRAVLVSGSPVRVGRGAREDELRAAQLELERTLNEITREADETWGHPPVTPE
jgi:hypothetical protein